MRLIKPIQIIKRPLFFPLVVLIIFILYQDRHLSQKELFPLELLNKKSWFEGVIAEDPVVDGDKVKLIVEVKVVKPNNMVRQAHHVPYLVSLTGHPELVEGWETANLSKDDTIRFYTKLKEPSSYKNPGSFDYEKFLKRKGIGATGFIENQHFFKIIDHKEPPFWGKKILKIRSNIKNILADHHNPSSSAILTAFLWGDEGGLEEEIKSLFRDSGLTHLLVISGLNFAALAFIFYQISLRIVTLYPRIFLLIPAKKLASGICLILLTLYFIFCFSSPSLVRAYVAISCYLVAIILNRSRDLLNILFAAALIILIINPSDLFNLSFQFSFVAVLSLILITPFLNRFSEQIEPSQKKSSLIFKHFLNMVYANLSIFIGLTPLIVFYFHTLPWSSLMMNLWGVPFLELIILPVGLLSLLVYFVSPQLASYLFLVDLKLIDGFVYFLKFLSQKIPPPFLWFPPHPWELVLYYFLLLILIFKIRPVFKKTVAIFVLSIFLLDIGYWAIKNFWDTSFKITQLDVGQGDSLLVELPGPQRILVDGGGSPYFDIGENVLIPFLLYQRIASLDVVVITHADTDHYLGLQSLIEKFHIKEIWFNGILKEDPSYQKLFSTAFQKKIPVKILNQGTKINMGDESFIEVLSPSEKEDGKDNNQSLVLKITSKGNTALLTGDIEWEIEDQLVEQFDNHLDVDYLKIAHHGSRTSTSLRFLELTSPQVTTAGLKKDNRFGHPHSQVINRLNQLKIPFYRTDIYGAIEVIFDDEKIKVKPFIVLSPTR